MALVQRFAPAFKGAFLLALAVFTWLALDPTPTEILPISNADKLAHLMAYVVLAFLLDAGWPQQRFVLWKWLVLLGYGMTIELLQSQIPTRDFSLADMATNACGIALYAFAFAPLLRRWGLR